MRHWLKPLRRQIVDHEEHKERSDPVYAGVDGQPLLMIAGTKADSLYMTEDAFAKATGTKDKEFFKIEGATHIETYWVPKYADAALSKLSRFMQEPSRSNH